MANKTKRKRQDDTNYIARSSSSVIRIENLRNHSKKGVLDIDFILSVFVFLSVIVFVTSVIIGNIPVFHRESLNENLRARSYQISELLLFDQGEPPDWSPVVGDPNEVKRIGLSTGDAYEISRVKIDNLEIICSDYSRLRTLLIQDLRNELKVSISDASGNVLLDCGPAVSATILPEFPVTRYGVLEDNTIVKILVSVV